MIRVNNGYMQAQTNKSKNPKRTLTSSNETHLMEPRQLNKTLQTFWRHSLNKAAANNSGNTNNSIIVICTFKSCPFFSFHFEECCKYGFGPFRMDLSSLQDKKLEQAEMIGRLIEVDWQKF